MRAPRTTDDARAALALRRRPVHRRDDQEWRCHDCEMATTPTPDGWELYMVRGTAGVPAGSAPGRGGPAGGRGLDRLAAPRPGLTNARRATRPQGPGGLQIPGGNELAPMLLSQVLAV